MTEPTPLFDATDPLAAPLSSLLRQEPVSCSCDSSVREALAKMRAANVGSILLTDADARPVGMFTLKDLRDRVALDHCDLDQAMRAVMTPNPHALPETASAIEAALAMARHSIHHLLVTRSGRVAGVISEKDLFALHRVGVSGIAIDLARAPDLASLVAAAADIRDLTRKLMAQGVRAEALTRLISQLNDRLTGRILELTFAEQEETPWCWLALGSEGRLEQTLYTDQDNGLIFAAPESRRGELLAAARLANEWLDACGFPLCRGNVMASNPQWCLSLEEWQDTFADWIFRGDAPVLLNASIFFDFRPLAGQTRLAIELRAWLSEKLKGQRPFLKRMVTNALENHPPLGWFRDFEVDADKTIDLKLRGTTPFVDASRIFALAAGVDATGTVPRLHAVADVWKMRDTGWVAGFLFIQQLRLRLHQSQLESGSLLSNHIDPRKLGEVERQGLKEAFRQAQKMQRRLENHFQF